MALDASEGAVEGVKASAEQAMRAGAPKEGIVETIREAQYISGVGIVYTAARAFKELFVQDNIWFGKHCQGSRIENFTYKE